jgi:surfeit locus 1 family protein
MPTRRLIVLLAALVAALITARLGWWQLDRAAQKEALQRSLDVRRTLPPVRAELLASHVQDAAEQHHRRVELRGRWLAEATVYLDNRPMDGRPGFIVVTPLMLPDGSAVVVQRGWLPRDVRDRTRVRAPVVPSGEVRIEGRIAPPPSRLLELAGENGGVIRQNLDLDAYARELRVPLRPLSVLQEGPAESGPEALQRHWPAPAADVHKHYGYAAQWFGLATLVTLLYVWFQLVRPRRPVAR